MKIVLLGTQKAGKTQFMASCEKVFLHGYGGYRIKDKFTDKVNLYWIIINNKQTVAPKEYDVLIQTDKILHRKDCGRLNWLDYPGEYLRSTDSTEYIVNKSLENGEDLKGFIIFFDLDSFNEHPEEIINDFNLTLKIRNTICARMIRLDEPFTTVVLSKMDTVSDCIIDDARNIISDHLKKYALDDVRVYTSSIKKKYDCLPAKIMLDVIRDVL